jgi:hypothetical protein
MGTRRLPTGAERAPATLVLVAPDGSEAHAARLPPGRPDVALVDAVARVALEARRRGLALRLRDASDELRGLLELVGLAGVLAVEPRRQPELGEELRVEEVVQSRDPPV